MLARGLAEDLLAVLVHRDAGQAQELLLVEEVQVQVLVGAEGVGQHPVGQQPVVAPGGAAEGGHQRRDDLHLADGLDVRQGASVNLRDIVARGILPSRYVIIEAAKTMRLKKSSDLGEYLRVSIGEGVNPKTVLAEVPKQRNKCYRHIFFSVCITSFIDKKKRDPQI